MRAYFLTRLRKLFPAKPEERLPALNCYSALSFMALIVIATLPYRPF